MLSHIPFYLDAEGTRLEAHIARSNPIVQALASDARAVVSVVGPDGYVSPDWYGDEGQVPTWNYVAVHLRGVVRRAPQDGLRDHLDRLSSHFESRLAPKPVWQTDKLGPEKLAKLMTLIVPIELQVEKVDGTWKLNQNKSEVTRVRAAAHMDAAGLGQEVAALSDLMRGAR